MLRRALPKGEAAERTEDGQPTLPGLVIEHKGGDWHEHAVLVMNWAQEELRAIAQIYRDRGDRREHVRRAEESMGMDRILDGGPEAEPTDGADGGVDLQLVEYLHADGDGEPARGDDHDTAVISAWDVAADPACQPSGSIGFQSAR